MSSAICFNLDQSKILSSGNGLKKKKDLVENRENTGYQTAVLFHSIFENLHP